MKYSLQTEHIDLTDNDHELIDEKMERMEKRLMQRSKASSYKKVKK